MNEKPRPYRLKLQELRYIIFRNVFFLTNGIILAVVLLLFFIGSRQAALFIGIVSVLNLTLGLIQDIWAWVTLEKLQLLTAPRATRLNQDGSEETILIEEVNKGDKVRLKTGDQVSCDSLVIEAQGLEINEGLITGESTSISKSINDHLLAGSIITSGSGSIIVETSFQGSRIARMTEGIKKYSKEVSPIQHSVDLVIKYSSYVLLLGIIFVIVRGIITHSSLVRVVLSVGALSSFLVPQGLVFALTLFFAYGAINLFRRNVLLQEVNATEKLGRIKNLCMDKTGTLTENTLAVESMHVPGVITKEDARRLTSAYIQGTHDSSEIMRAVSKFINYEYKGKNEEAVTFSSWRQYGGVRIQDKVSNTIVLVGSADIFLPQVVAGEQKKWLEQIIDTNSHQGRHVLCIVQTTGTVLPKNLSREKLSIVAAFVFYNNLREGIRTTIGFFQNRGVSIRIISGDNPETVRTVAELSGVKNTDRLITGKEMEAWSATDFELKVKSYALFARILPEQKEKIIEAFKKNGFTAMVGDGANDALAIKKADLGIAMFDGAQATRQLASVVLTNNSFTALPGGVRLADVIIKNIEIFSSVFFNQMLLGLFFFIIISILGRDFPFTPLNITFINYFTVGIPSLLVSYWTIRPIRKIYPMAQGSFLKRVLPFVFWSTVLQIIGVVVIYVLSPDYLKMAESNTLVILAFIVFGLVFFACAPSVYHGSTTKSEKRQISILLAFEILLIFIALHIAFFNTFFNLTYLSLPIKTSLEVLGVLLVYCYLQYLVSRLFSVPPSKKLS